MTGYRLCSQVGREFHKEGLYVKERERDRMKDDCKAQPAEKKNEKDYDYHSYVMLK